jgi:hypothetical protein
MVQRNAAQQFLCSMLQLCTLQLRFLADTMHSVGWMIVIGYVHVQQPRFEHLIVDAHAFEEW